MPSYSTGQADVQQQLRNMMSHSNYRVCQRPNPQLFNFDGQVVNFKSWRNKMLDHLVKRSTPKYKTVIAQIEANANPILQANFEHMFIDNVNAWEVATALDGFSLTMLTPMCMSGETSSVDRRRATASKNGGRFSLSILVEGPSRHLVDSGDLLTILDALD